MTLGNKRKISGFTLVEAVIVIFIISLLLLVLFSLYDWHSKVYTYEQAQVRVTGSTRASMDLLALDISQAYRVLASASVNGTNYNSDASNIVLQLPSVDSSGAIIAGKWDYAAFYSSGQNFYVTTQLDASSMRQNINKNLSDSLSSLVFTYNNADFNLVKKVTVDLTAAVTVRNQTPTSHLTQDIYLKNYY